MEEFFWERGHYGTLEHMRPAFPESMCRERREKQQLESDLYIVTKQLKREPLSIGDIKDFKAWKQDLMEAWAAMYLPIEEYQSTVNHLIVTRLDSDVHATVIDLLPKDEEEFVARKLEAIFQQIEERLVNMDQAEHRRLRFDLAKQQVEEDPGKYETRLRRYYKEALLRDE